MNLYFSGYESLKGLGDILGEYLNLECEFIEPSKLNSFRFTKDDILYSTYNPNDNLYRDSKMIAIEPTLQQKWSEKAYQYESFNGLLPMPAYKIYNDLVECKKDLAKCKYKKYVCSSIGAGGVSSIIYNGDVDRINKVYDKNNLLIVKEYIPKEFDISTHLLIGDENYIVMTPIVKQSIGEDQVTFEGGTYPVELNDKQLIQVNYICNIIGRELAKDGVRGCVGVDMMVYKDVLFFTELNLRPMLTSLGVSKVMEKMWGTNIPVMTYQILYENKKPQIKNIGTYDKGWELIKYNDINDSIDFKEYSLGDN